MKLSLIALLVSICSGCAVTPYYPVNSQVIIRTPVIIPQPVVVYRPPVIIYQPPIFYPPFYYGHFHRHR
jgi:hypothetical protein